MTLRKLPTSTQTALAVVLGAVLLVSAGTAQARKGFKDDVALASTGTDEDAGGRAKLSVRGSDDGRFLLQVNGLDANNAYQIVLDDVRVGDVTTNSKGRGRVRFRSNPRTGKDEFLGFDPRGGLLSVRDDAGRDLLAATIATGGSGSSDDGDIICCVPDDSGTECEDRTVEECAAEGGVVSAADSCLPNPCGGAQGPDAGDIVCCLPDDSGPECEDRTVEERAAEGGVVVAAPAATMASVGPAAAAPRCACAARSAPRVRECRWTAAA